MSRRFAPTALRMPISRVRSVTETSMMFMMPMPPTSKEMPAIAPRKSVKTPRAALTASMRSLGTHDDKIIVGFIGNLMAFAQDLPDARRAGIDCLFLFIQQLYTD